MRIYFFSETPCALKSSGLLLGFVDGFERSFDAELQDRLFLEIVPLDGAPSVGFLLAPELLRNPPDFLTVYEAPSFLALSFAFPPKREFAVLAQLEGDKSLYTLFWQDGLYLSVGTESDDRLLRLPDTLSDARLRLEDGLLLLDGAKTIAAVSPEGELCYACQAEGRDCLGRKFRAVREGRQCRLVAEETEIPPGKLPFAFLENLRLHADVSACLDESISGKADELSAFLGPFAFVVPYEDTAAIGIQTGERRYRIRPVRFTMRNGKIENLAFD